MLADAVAHEKLARRVFDKPNGFEARHPTRLGQEPRFEEHVASLDLLASLVGGSHGQKRERGVSVSGTNARVRACVWQAQAWPVTGD